MTPPTPSEDFCKKRRISCFFQKALDNTSPEFSTKFSHFSPGVKDHFCSFFPFFACKKALFHKVLHIFHSFFHNPKRNSRASLWKTFFHSSPKHSLGKMYKFSKNCPLFRQAVVFPLSFWGVFPVEDLPFHAKKHGFSCENFYNPLYKVPFVAYNIR